jgi:hypothetical protein
MVAQISFNPVITTVAQGTFNVSSQGHIQGTAMNDPAVRNSLAGGVLSPNETLPMWGGVAISETTTPISTSVSAPSSSLGGYITRATTITATAANGLTGFSVFDQNSAGITSPQSPVPLSGSGQLVNFYRLGSGARIAVPCDPALVSLEGNIISQQVSWDFSGERLVPYAAAYPAATVSNAVWASTSGGQITYTVGIDLTSYLAAGNDIAVTGIVSTGGTGVGLNGSFTIVSISATTIVVTDVQSASPGTYVSGGSTVAGGGALPVRLLDLQIGNSMTVSYNSVTGFASWNYNGSTAIILI